MNPLRFDPTGYEIKTEQCGGHEIECKEYLALPYAAKPAAPEYQCLNIYIPLSVDGSVVDAQNAPILLQNMCNGYNSYSVKTPPPAHPFRRSNHRPANAPRIGPAPGYPGYRDNGKDKMFLPLTEGMTLVVAGNRGRNNYADGIYFGKAPAAIVDLKAAVRFLRANRDLIPGDTEHIVSIGSSAGGAMSALLGASGNDSAYEPYLRAIGAMEERDDVFASVCVSPVLDLEHQDMAYEWQYGALPVTTPQGETLPPVNQALSRQLAGMYEEYLRSLELNCRGGYGKLTPETYREYYLKEFLQPSAARWLRAQDAETAQIYLEDRPWLHWDGDRAEFLFSDYESYLGRLKGLVPFDTLEFGRAENTLFGGPGEPAAHFTEFSLRHTVGADAMLNPMVLEQRALMNPMTRLRNGNGVTAKHWWLRAGAKESGFALPLFINLAAQLEKMNKDVNIRLAWDAGHCSEDDRPELLRWIKTITDCF